MAIDVGTFKSNLQDFLENYDDSRRQEHLAEKIVEEYVAQIVEKGTDSLSMNTLNVIPANQDGLVQGFIDMFQNSIDNNVELDLAIVVPSLIAFWAGGTLTVTGTVPGTVGTVSAVVTAPGSPIPIPFPPPVDNATEFVDTIATFFETHLPTIAFLITGLVPVSGAAPVPTPFPTVGYI